MHMRGARAIRQGNCDCTGLPHGPSVVDAAQLCCTVRAPSPTSPPSPPREQQPVWRSMVSRGQRG